MAQTEVYFTSWMTMEDIDMICRVTSDFSKKEIVAKRLQENAIIANNAIYTFDPSANLWKKVTGDIKSNLPYIATQFIATSLQEIRTSQDQRVRDAYRMLLEEYEKQLLALEKPSFASSGSIFDKMLMLPSHIKFDVHGNTMHFLNGHFDLQLYCFVPLGTEKYGRQREHYIATALPYQYDGDIPDQIQYDKELQLVEVLLRTYGSAQNVEAIFYSLAKSLLMRTEDSDFQIHWGEGGCGKSTLLDIIITVFGNGVYAQRLDTKALRDDDNFDMSIRGVGPNIKFLVCEESQYTPKALSNLKLCVDGRIPMRKKRGNQVIDHIINARLLMTSNPFVEFDETDTGMLRRAMYIHYTDPIPEGERNALFRPEAIENWPDFARVVVFKCFARAAKMYFDDRTNQKLFDNNIRFVRGLDLGTWASFIDDLFVMGGPLDKVPVETVWHAANSYFMYRHRTTKDVVDNLKRHGIQHSKKTKYGDKQMECFIGINLKFHQQAVPVPAATQAYQQHMLAQAHQAIPVAGQYMNLQLQDMMNADDV
jgi:hypothetical protein